MHHLPVAAAVLSASSSRVSAHIAFQKMNYTPFTLEEATEIADDFEDLEDTEFSFGESTAYMVHKVIIAPFGNQERAEFIAQYESTRNGKQSLEAYTGNEYEVLLVAADLADEERLVYLHIREFVAEKGIKYSFP